MAGLAGLKTTHRLAKKAQGSKIYPTKLVWGGGPPVASSCRQHCATFPIRSPDSRGSPAAKRFQCTIEPKTIESCILTIEKENNNLNIGDHPVGKSACPWVATEIFVFKWHVLVYSETPFKAHNSHKIHCMLTWLTLRFSQRKYDTSCSRANDSVSMQRPTKLPKCCRCHNKQQCHLKVKHFLLQTASHVKLNCFHS